MQKSTLSSRIRGLLWWFKENKKAQVWLMVGTVIVLVLVLIGLIVVVNRRNSSQQDASELLQLNVNADLPKEVSTRFIDGVEVDFGYENLFPWEIMIENYVTVRPQSGLQSAQVVYEALVEGGITRFLAIYASHEPIEEIGPVRSARHYFVDWAEEYRGLYIHEGGSPQALSQLYGNEYLTDLSQLGGAHAYFWRDSSVPSPHNLFTSSELVTYALRDKELDSKVGTFSPWKFVSESSKKNRPEEEKKVSFEFSSSSYSVEYVYDREKNWYLRSNGGEEHKDKLTNEQIHVNNLVIQFVSVSLIEADTGRLDVETQGEGRVVVFHDGIGMEGVWKKESADDRTRFYTEQGSEISFIPGNIWIEVLPDDRTIEYN